MKKYRITLLSIAVAIFMIGCGGTMSNDTQTEPGVATYLSDDASYNQLAAEENYDRKSSTPESLTIDGTRTQGHGGKDLSTVKLPEKIIKDANIGIAVEDYTAAMNQIKSMIKANKAYVASEDQSNSSYQIANTLVIRVPNVDFEDLVAGISSVALDVEYSQINARDVTAEFVDVEARIKAKKEVEARYYEILKTAKTVGEVLEVEDKIRVIREELEAAQGRLKLLKDQVNYSTVTLNIHQQIEQPSAAVAGFWDNMGNGLENGWSGILYFFIGLANIWPMLLLALIVVVIVRRYIKKVSARRAVATQPPAYPSQNA